MNSSLIAVALCWTALLAMLAVTDWFLLPPPEALQVDRVVDEKLSLGAPNPVRVRVRNAGRLALKLELRDSPPDTMRTDQGDVPFSITIAPNARHAAIYHVTPT